MTRRPAATTTTSQDVILSYSGSLVGGAYPKALHLCHLAAMTCCHVCRCREIRQCSCAMPIMRTSCRLPQLCAATSSHHGWHGWLLPPFRSTPSSLRITDRMGDPLQSAKDRLSSLSIDPFTSTSTSVPLHTYAFKPKSGEHKIVLVVALESEDVGKASALAKALGLKDMRAAEEEYVMQVLGEGKATGASQLSCSSKIQLVWKPDDCHILGALATISLPSFHFRI